VTAWWKGLAQPFFVRSCTKPFIRILEPSDVLFGRGMTIQRHSGNVNFRRCLEPKVEAYYKADNMEKVILVDYLM
jgi:hypothetical protein